MTTARVRHKIAHAPNKTSRDIYIRWHVESLSVKHTHALVMQVACQTCERAIEPAGDALLCATSLSVAYCSAQCAHADAHANRMRIEQEGAADWRAHDIEPAQWVGAVFGSAEQDELAHVEGRLNQLKLYAKWKAPFLGRTFRFEVLEDIQRWERQGKVEKIRDVYLVASRLRRKGLSRWKKDAFELIEMNARQSLSRLGAM